MAKHGRPSRYTPKVATEILSRLAAGESLRAICASEHLPAESTVRSWVIDDVEKFSAQYARARDMGIDALAEETLQIADDGRNDTYTEYDADGNALEKVNHDHIRRSQLRVAARQWYVSKLAPKKYGDKVNHEVTGRDGAPVTFRWAQHGEADNGE